MMVLTNRRKYYQGSHFCGLWKLAFFPDRIDSCENRRKRKLDFRVHKKVRFENRNRRPETKEVRKGRNQRDDQITDPPIPARCVPLRIGAEPVPRPPAHYSFHMSHQRSKLR